MYKIKTIDINAQECLNLFNCIDNFANKELTLKDVYIIWED